MGKIDISEDLRNKLNKVLSYKSADIVDTPVGPAPSWKPHPPHPPPQLPPQPPTQPPPQLSPQLSPQPAPQPAPQQPQYYKVKHYKNKKDKIKYYKITKVVFLSSVVAGIGLTLGLKIANILFF